MKIIFNTILYLLCTLLVQAQESAVFRSFTSKDGLAGNETYWVTRDTLGYLWIGTDRGLSKFDGKRFYTYTEKDGLGSTFVDHIFINPNNNQVWVRCLDRMLYYFDGIGFKPAAFNESLKKLFAGKITVDCINDIHFKGNDVLYLYSPRVGKLQVSGKNVTPLKTAITKNELFVDENFKLGAIAVKPTPVTSLIKNTTFLNQQFYVHQGSNQPPRSGTIRLSPNSYYAFFDNYLFLVKDNKVVNFYDYKNYILSIYQDANGSLWVVTFSYKGVLKYPPNQFPTANNGTLLFNGYAITSMTNDFEGGYWFTTHDNGLIYLPGLHITQLTPPLNADVAETMQKVAAYKGQVFVGTNKSRIIQYENFWDAKRFSSSILQLTNASTPFIFNSPDFFNFLQVDKERNMLYMAKPYFLKYNLATNKPKSYRGRGMYFFSLNDSIDLSCHESAFVFWNKDTVKKLVRTKRYAFSAMPDDAGNLWLGFVDGLYKYSGDSVVKDKNIFTPFRINKMLRLPDGNIAGATIGDGVFIFNSKTSYKVSLGNSSRHNTVNDIDISGDTLFCATQSGIVWFIYGQHDKVHYIGPSTGYDFYEVKSLSYDQNNLYLISENKLFKIDFSSINVEVFNTPVFITKLIVADSIAYSNPVNISLRSGQKKVKIFFEALSYKNANNTIFQYRLLKSNTNSDVGWRSTPNTEIELFALDPGQYAFLLRAVNEDGLPSTIVKTLLFEIKAPFYKRLWFWILCGLLFIFITYLFNSARIKRIEKKNEIAEQMLKYEQQALASQINPHFIFNSLNSIQAFILKKDERQSLKYLTKFSRLMRLSLDNSRAKWVEPQAEIDLINVYMELEKLRFTDKFEYVLEIDPGFDKENYLIAPMLAQPFIENAIKHGVNALTDKMGFIKISAVRQGNTKNVLIRIEDNGIGRRRAKEIDTDVTRTHVSSGMDITVNRIKLLSKEAGIPFYFKIIDKPNDGGTIVEFNLPFKKKDNTEEK